jgi:hypothetical protein
MPKSLAQLIRYCGDSLTESPIISPSAERFAWASITPVAMGQRCRQPDPHARLHGKEQRLLLRRQLAVAHLSSPGEQQAGIEIMPRRDLVDRRSRLQPLRNNPHLVFDAPPTPTLAPRDDLNSPVHHDLQHHLKVTLRCRPCQKPAPSSRRVWPDAYEPSDKITVLRKAIRPKSARPSGQEPTGLHAQNGGASRNSAQAADSLCFALRNRFWLQPDKAHTAGIRSDWPL